MFLCMGLRDDMDWYDQASQGCLVYRPKARYKTGMFKLVRVIFV